jgi:GNAT superfamily N-acetyltransferase
MLHTHPQHQKRGAASALIQWGVDKGEQLRLPVYLEASGVAHPLYHKHGFEYVDVHRVDLTPFGGTGMEHTAPIMLRDSRVKAKL